MDVREGYEDDREQEESEGAAEAVSEALFARPQSQGSGASFCKVIVRHDGDEGVQKVNVPRAQTSTYGTLYTPAQTRHQHTRRDTSTSS